MLSQHGASVSRHAPDPRSGVTREYLVDTYRSRDGAVTAEVWLRYEGDMGGESDCTPVRGSLTVRRGDRAATERVAGSVCVF